MKISTKGRYALRMMLDLAEHPDDGFVSLKDIAGRQNISKKYLEQIVPLLVRSGFLQTGRGFQGGYLLSRAPEQYTIAEILHVTEGSLAPVTCLDGRVPGCDRQADCAALPLWTGLNRTIYEYLSGYTLKDLLEQEHARGVVPPGDTEL